MMRALLGKEWRLNRPVLIGCLVTTVLPYVVTVANLWINPSRYTTSEPRHYIQGVQFAAYACLVITVIIAAAFGGLTFAGERRERTAEFLGMLPVSREAIIVSKLLVPLACLAVLITVHLLVLVACIAWADRIAAPLRGAEEGIVFAAASAVSFGVAMFGIAWGLSVFLRSPAIAATIALGVGVGMFFGMMEWADRAQQFLRDRLFPWAGADDVAMTVVGLTALTIGVGAVIFSSLYYRRRVEP